MTDKLTDHEREFIECLFREMHQLLVNKARSYFDYNLAMEAVQEAMLRACHHKHDLMASPNPQGWMMNALTNSAKKIVERRGTYNRYCLLDDSIFDILIDPEAHLLDPDLLYKGIVSREDYHILRRIGIEGYSIKELADELEINLVAARKRLQRARDRFKKQYARQIEAIEKQKKL